MQMEQEKKVNVWECLKKRYPSNEYAMMAEVSDAAGFNRSRSADYVVMNLWPSRGLSIIGIEQKASRSDWLSELKKPAKAENIFKYCDYWNLLTTKEGIANLSEIPPTWGWLCIKGASIRVMKEAPKLNPQSLNKHFVACLLKRACNNALIHPSQIEERIKQGIESKYDSQKGEVDRLRNDVKNLSVIISNFEEASGIKIHNRWDYGKDPTQIGEAVKLVLEGGIDKWKKQLIGLKDNSARINKFITDIVDKL